MKFKKIRFKNFLSFGNKFTEFNLDSNKTVLISGSNAVGKSSILESIYFAMTGKSYRNINKGKLVNNINRKNLLIELELEHKNNKYLIKRGITPNIFEIHKNGKLLDEDSNILDYQKQLEYIFGFDNKSFKQTIMMSTRYYTPFLELKLFAKREFIERMFSLKLFSDMNVFLKRKTQNTKQNIKGLNKELEYTTEKIKMLQDINSKQINMNKFQKNGLMDQIQELEEANSEIDSKIKKEEKKIQEEEKIYFDLREKFKFKKKITKKLDIINYKIQEIKNKIDFFKNNDSCGTCKQKIDQIFKEKTIQEEKKLLNKNTEEKEKFIEALDKIKKIDLKISKINKKLNSLRQNIMMNKSIQDGNNFRIKEKKKLINDLDKTTLIDKKEFSELNKNLLSLRKKENQLKIFLKYVDTVQDLISDKGIKQFIISKYIPILNTLLNKYLKIFEAPYSVLFDNEFKETIISQGFDDLGYGNLSAGEKQRLDSALLFSFLELSKMKNSIQTNLIILDEVLDQSLDQSGIDGILKIFEDMKNQGYTILTVSHREFFADSFDQIFQVQKKKFSSIEEMNE